MDLHWTEYLPNVDADMVRHGTKVRDLLAEAEELQAQAYDLDAALYRTAKARWAKAEILSALDDANWPKPTLD